jgi:NTP pyrophosphatase (non-canonical NTP hydrolase)
MDVKALQWELAAFVAERGLESRHSPKSLAMALVGEGGTLLDLFKWLGDDESRQVGRQDREAVAEALAEILLHAFRLADELGIDIEEAVAKKRTKLTGKAPAERRPEAAPPAPPSPEPRPAKPAPGRPVPIAGPPSVRPSRHASHVPDFPRVRQAAAPPAPPPASPPPRAAAPPPPPSPPPRAAAPPPPPRPAPRPAAPPPPPPPPPPPVEPYADLDLDAVTELVKELSRRVDAAQSDEPLARELHDELGTLKRTLYGKTLKRSWVGTTLESVREKLLEATRESIGEALKARDYIAQIDRILNDG